MLKQSHDRISGACVIVSGYEFDLHKSMFERRTDGFYLGDAKVIITSEVLGSDKTLPASAPVLHRLLHYLLRRHHRATARRRRQSPTSS